MLINLVGNGGGTGTAGVTSLNDQKGDLKLKTVNSNDLLGEGNIEIQAGVTSVNGQEGAVVIDVPTKVSQLENDANFQTQEQVAVSITEAMSGATGGMEYVSLKGMTSTERTKFFKYFSENLDANGIYHGNKWPFILQNYNYVPAAVIKLQGTQLSAYYYTDNIRIFYEYILESGGHYGVYEESFAAQQTNFNVWELYENTEKPLKLDNTDRNVELYGSCFLGDRNANGGPTRNNYSMCSLKLVRNNYVYHCLGMVIYQTDNENYGYFNFIYEGNIYKYSITSTAKGGSIWVNFFSKTPLGNINSSEVRNIKVLTQAEYEASDPKDEKTLYMIKG